MPRAKRQRKPKHRTEVRAWAFPLVESRAPELHAVRVACWELRNQLVRDREANRRAVREGTAEHYLTRNDQYRVIAELARRDPRYGAIHSQVLQNVADRIDEGYRRWFEALKEGRSNVRPPHEIDLHRYRSFTYTQYGTSARLRHGRIELSKLGSFAVHDYRKVRGKKKTATLKFRDGRWWVIITATIQAVDLYEAEATWQARPDVGLDPGLAAVLTDSGGEKYATPKPLRAAQRKLCHEQRRMARQFEARKALHEAAVEVAKAAKLPAPLLRAAPRSGRLQRQIRAVARLHTKVARVRDYWHKKNARLIAERFGRVAVELHGLDFMLQNRRQARATADVAIAAQRFALASALGPQRYVETPNQRPGIGGNSQTCLCGEAVPKTLKDRVHNCPACGLHGDRDWMAANIVQHLAFGTVHESVVQACGQQALPVALALLERRGGVESGVAATRPDQSARAAETSVKRRPRASARLEHTTGGEPTVAGKTPVASRARPRPPGHRRTSTLPVAPQTPVPGS